jgi:hypothetical protein
VWLPVLLVITGPIQKRNNNPLRPRTLPVTRTSAWMAA